jgi:hypothetical protein
MDGAYVHFRSAVFAVHQPRQGVNVAVPIRSFYRSVFQYTLYVFKGFSVDDRLMHIFKYLPLAPIHIDRVLVPVMGCSFKINHITAVFLSRQNTGQGAFVPVISFFLFQRFAFCRSSVMIFQKKDGVGICSFLR